MAISVTCPACLKRFSVSDKFAGKSGPCPNCQKPIKIPEKSEEIVIHGPDTAAPKDAKGRSILKPIRRKEIKLPLPILMAYGLGSMVVLGVSLGLGLSGGAPAWLLALGAVLLAVPLVFTGYWFMHDDELEGFGGRELWIRVGVCSAIFAAIWAIYVYVPQYVTGDDQLSSSALVVMLPIMLAIGTAVSVAALELEIIQGLLHYGLYFGVTFFLAWLSGAQLTGDADSAGRVPSSPPAITRPDTPGPQTPKSAPPQPSPDAPVVPNLLQ